MAFEEVVAKGRRLEARFYRRVGLPLSPFRDFAQFEQYGWEEESLSQYSREGAPIAQDTAKLALYRDIGLSPHPNQNTKNLMRHVNTTVSISNPGQVELEGIRPVRREYAATGSIHTCIYKPRVIFFQSGESPFKMGRQRGILGCELVPLRHWSDVVFLTYQELCSRWGSSVKEIRAILHLDVPNETTDKVVKDALHYSGMPLRDWPEGLPLDHPTQGHGHGNLPVRNSGVSCHSSDPERRRPGVLPARSFGRDGLQDDLRYQRLQKNAVRRG